MFYKRKRAVRLSPKFFGCPVECCFDQKKPFDNNRREFCGDCDVKKIEDKFKADSLDLWEKRLGEKAKKFRFEKIVSVVYTVIGFEDLPPEKMSVKTRHLLDAYLGEKAKFERIEQFNRD